MVMDPDLYASPPTRREREEVTKAMSDSPTLENSDWVWDVVPLRKCHEFTRPVERQS